MLVALLLSVMRKLCTLRRPHRYAALCIDMRKPHIYAIEGGYYFDVANGEIAGCNNDVVGWYLRNERRFGIRY